MDFLTQQFIAAAKHLREEVAALRESINTLRDQQERQYQEQQAQRKLPQPPIGVEAEIHEKPHAEGENQFLSQENS